jgi:hypothetical protein
MAIGMTLLFGGERLLHGGVVDLLRDRGWWRWLGLGLGFRLRNHRRSHGQLVDELP